MDRKVFILEDDLNIQQLLGYNLEKSGYAVMIYGTAEDMLADKSLPEAGLFILDIMLPGDMDGYQVCRRLKESPAVSGIPVIFLTAKSEEFDAVLGLELGAEDYIKKPFGIRELLSRIKVVLRRTDAETQPARIEKDGLLIDTSRHTAYKDGKELLLSLKEFELLRILMENSGRALTRDLLLEKVWGFEYLGESRTVDVHIRHLRQKIEDDDSDPAHIVTVRGIGYKFKDTQEKR